MLGLKLKFRSRQRGSINFNTSSNRSRCDEAKLSASGDCENKPHKPKLGINSLLKLGNITKALSYTKFPKA